jgi:hypothetical protein
VETERRQFRRANIFGKTEVRVNTLQYALIPFQFIQILLNFDVTCAGSIRQSGSPMNNARWQLYIARAAVAAATLRELQGA